MYSTKLQSDLKRYIVKCIINMNGPKFLDFVVDTGAKYTCCSAMAVDSKLTEAQFENAESKLLGGMITGHYIKVYKFCVNQFTIGSIDMGKRDIWITFDKRVSDDVLGMDILSDVFFMQDANLNTLFFDNDKEQILKL